MIDVQYEFKETIRLNTFFIIRILVTYSFYLQWQGFSYESDICPEDIRQCGWAGLVWIGAKVTIQDIPFPRSLVDGMTTVSFGECQRL